MSAPTDLRTFLLKSRVDPSDGNAFVETTVRPRPRGVIVNSATWIHQLPYDPTISSEELFKKGVGETGALSLESIVRRKIVRDLVKSIDECLLKRTPWESIGKKIWHDIEITGQDSFAVWKTFAEAYRGEPDFMVAEEEDACEEGEEEEYDEEVEMNMMRKQEHYEMSYHFGEYWSFFQCREDVQRVLLHVRRAMRLASFNKYMNRMRSERSKDWAKIVAKALIPESCPEAITIETTCRVSSKPLRFREQPFFGNYPSWESLTKHLYCSNPASPTFLTILELNHDLSRIPSWTVEDLKQLGNINTLTVLSIHGPHFQQFGRRIITDGYLDFWARSAKGTKGEKFGNLRILILQDNNFCSMPLPMAMDSTERAKKDRAFFKSLNCFPKLSVISLTAGIQVPFAPRCHSPNDSVKNEYVMAKKKKLMKQLYRAGASAIQAFSHAYMDPRTFRLQRERLCQLARYADEECWWNEGKDISARDKPSIRHLLRPWSTKDLARAAGILIRWEEGGSKGAERKWKEKEEEGRNDGAPPSPIFLNPYFWSQVQQRYEPTVIGQQPVNYDREWLEKLVYVAARDYGECGPFGCHIEDERVVFERYRDLGVMVRGKQQLLDGEQQDSNMLEENTVTGDSMGNRDDYGDNDDHDKDGKDDAASSAGGIVSERAQKRRINEGEEERSVEKKRINTGVNVSKDTSATASSGGRRRSVKETKKKDMGSLLSEFMY